MARIGYLWIYNALWALFYPLVLLILKRRLRRGKEHPDRWREKLGRATKPRPQGRLVWCHGVGLGEVLALRGLVTALGTADPNLRFLMTSSTRQSAEVIANQLPPHAIHQFLPLDNKGSVNRFLNHWQPDLAIWTDQDLWPNMTFQLRHKNIPCAYIAARLHKESYQKRSWIRPLYAPMLQGLGILSAIDAQTQENLTRLGGQNVRLDGSLKPICPPLVVNRADFETWKSQLDKRFVWSVSSSYRADEAAALDAHRALLERRPDAMLVIVPRDISRGMAIRSDCAKLGLQAALLSTKDPVDRSHVLIADSLGQAGLWFGLCQIALIGGSFDQIQGHNPWEAIAFGRPVLHGPHIGNFASDYAELASAGLARKVENAGDILAALQDRNFLSSKSRHGALTHPKISQLISDLLDLMAERPAFSEAG